MNENKLIELLNRLDDDLVEQEIDKLMAGIEIDTDSISSKAYQKLKNGKQKSKGRKRLPYAIAACLCVLSITAVVYASDISEAFKGLFNKRAVYSTIVDGDAYYLKEGYHLNENIKLESVLVSPGNLEIELVTDLSLEPKDIKVKPRNDPDTVYAPGGYAQNKGEYFFCTFSSLQEDERIKPFQDFQLVIAGDSYEVSLEAAKGLDFNNKIYTSQAAGKMTGVNIFGTKLIDEAGEVDIRLIAQFNDPDLELVRFGRPSVAKLVSTTQNLGEEGIISSSTAPITEELYLWDENNNKYKLEVPPDAKGRPVTLFHTDAPQGGKLILKVPAIMTSYREQIDSLALNIPEEGEVDLNKEIDFKLQKAVLKKIKRVSPTSAQLEFELNTAGENDIKIRSFDLYSQDMQEIAAEFAGNKGIIKLSFAESPDRTDFIISYPYFIMNGDWVINME
ncbi:MAG: hypothetical protein ACOWWO_05240 [Peptococcaceae bacterium]